MWECKVGSCGTAQFPPAVDPRRRFALNAPQVYRAKTHPPREAPEGGYRVQNAG